MSTPPGLDGVEGAIDAELARRTAPQHGFLSWLQLLEAGLTPDDVHYRVKIGRLHRVHKGVYAIGHRPPGPHARAMAAVLACGNAAALSHRWAAWLWGIAKQPSDPVDVSAPSDHRHPGIRCHRTRTLTPHDFTIHYGIPTTTPARTLLDLADLLPDKELTRAVNQARLEAHLKLQDLALLLARSPGRRAARRLRRFVENPDAPTRSDFEDAFLPFTERYDLPRPEVNQIIHGHEVDALWRAQRLVVELDSRTFHDDPESFEKDRAKDADLLAHGYHVLRITWDRFENRPAEEAARLAGLLGSS